MTETDSSSARGNIGIPSENQLILRLMIKSKVKNIYPHYAYAENLKIITLILGRNIAMYFPNTSHKIIIIWNVNSVQQIIVDTQSFLYNIAE